MRSKKPATLLPFLLIVLLIVCGFAGVSVSTNRYWASNCWTEISDTAQPTTIRVTGDVATYDKPLRMLLTRRQITDPKTFRLVVHKSQRIMRLYADDKLVKTYVIALGVEADTRKKETGDLATPEGTYYICSKNFFSPYYRALNISYPNAVDARLGLKRKAITQAEYRQIVQAIKAKRCPPMTTALDGFISIHGGGFGQAYGSRDRELVDVYDWTQGSIAVDREGIKELYDYVPVGTVIKIME